MKIKIKHRFSLKVMIEIEADNLRGADLRGADLREAYLCGADLCGANLCGADLREAYLRGADLWSCIGNMIHVKSAQLSKWALTWTSDRLQIGCENKSIKEWFEATDPEIEKLDSAALPWWNENKELVKLLVEKSPAKPTGEE